MRRLLPSLLLAVSCASSSQRAAADLEAEALAAYQFHLARYIEVCAPSPVPIGFTAPMRCDEWQGDLKALLRSIRELENATRAGAAAPRQQERVKYLVRSMDEKWQ